MRPSPVLLRLRSSMKRPFALLLGAACLSTSAQSVKWPALPRDGFLSGRAATEADVKAGRAVFVLEGNGTVVGEPLGITIPQYARFKDKSKVVPAVVIQAETLNGQPLIGLRLLDGTYAMDLLAEVELLGTDTPK